MSAVRKAVLILLLGALIPAEVAGAAGGLPTLGKVDLTTLAGEGWFRASLMGKPVGYLHSSATVRKSSGARRLRTVEKMALKLDFGQGPLTVEATSIAQYAEDLSPLSFHVEQNEFGRLKTVDAVLRGRELHVSTTAAGTRKDKILTVGPHFASELIFAVAASQGALPESAQYDFQSFVPELELLVDFHVGCLGRETITVEGRQVDALKVSFTAKSLGLEMRWWLGPGADLVRQEVPGLMGLVLERVSEAEALAAATPLALSDHIAVTTRMGDTRRVTYVRLKATSTGVPAAELLPETPLQHVAAQGESDAEVEVKAETDTGLDGRSLPITDPALKEFLDPTDCVQSDAPAIVAKAKEIVGDERDAWAAAQKLVRWVYEKMGKVDHDPRPCTATECLQMMKGDCSEHATLLMALARAVGIPSKFVTGLVYLNDGYYYHAWNGLYVGRWVAVDPTWGEVTLDAAHLTLASGSLTNESFAKTNLAAVRGMGVLGLEVLEHRTR